MSLRHWIMNFKQRLIPEENGQHFRKWTSSDAIHRSSAFRSADNSTTVSITEFGDAQTTLKWVLMKLQCLSFTEICLSFTCLLSRNQSWVVKSYIYLSNILVKFYLYKCFCSVLFTFMSLILLWSTVTFTQVQFLDTHCE